MLQLTQSHSHIVKEWLCESALYGVGGHSIFLAKKYLQSVVVLKIFVLLCSEHKAMIEIGQIKSTT